MFLFYESNPITMWFCFSLIWWELVILMTEREKNTLNRAFSLLFVVLHTKVLRYFFFNCEQRYRIFFPRKRLRGTHSLDFRSGSEKKNKRVFFFPARNFRFFAVFFFFPQEKFTLHSLTQNQRPEKKNSPGKKKQHFYSLTRFSPKKYKF